MVRVIPLTSITMKILFKRKILREIKNHIDVENFIKDYKVFKYFKKIPIDFVDKINHEINNTKHIGFKEFKPWFRKTIPYPVSRYDSNFLILMGWEKDEVNRMITEMQKKNGDLLAEKIKENPEKYFVKYNRRKEYWMNIGFSEIEAIKKISERQITFSKEICIQKFGEEKGIEIFKERQKKWLKTLNNNPNINEIRKSQNSYKYNERSFDYLINRSNFLERNKEIIKDCLVCDNTIDFVDCVLNKTEVVCVSDVFPFIGSKILHKKYNITPSELKKVFYEKIIKIVKTGYYGKPIYHNGIRYKSIKEFKIALFFEKNNINFEYEKKYPNGKFISDFYLPDFNIFVEYYGLLDNKNLDNLKNQQISYYEKMIEKNKFCLENKIELIHDTNFDKLYKKLEKLIQNENKN